MGDEERGRFVPMRLRHGVESFGSLTVCELGLYRTTSLGTAKFKVRQARRREAKEREVTNKKVRKREKGKE